MVHLTETTPPTEDIRHIQPNTAAQIGGNSIGKGTAYVTERNVCWISESGEGFTILYPSISIHAISRDISAFPQECLYMMVDDNIEEIDDEEEPEEEDSEDTFTEIRFIPDDHSALDSIFRAMSDCQALHPDPDDGDSDDDFVGPDEHPVEADEEEEDEGVEADNDGNGHGLVLYQRAGVEGLDDDNEMDISGQFDDAEPEPDH